MGLVFSSVSKCTELLTPGLGPSDALVPHPHGAVSDFWEVREILFFSCPELLAGEHCIFKKFTKKRGDNGVVPPEGREWGAPRD